VKQLGSINGKASYEKFQTASRNAIGYMHLRVANQKNELGFYQGLLGFKEVKRENSSVYLSANGQKPYRVILTV
jgi:catechol-2,3-dioxygenase